MAILFHAPRCVVFTRRLWGNTCTMSSGQY